MQHGRDIGNPGVSVRKPRSKIKQKPRHPFTLEHMDMFGANPSKPFAPHPAYK
jgi:hypothetical protein